MKDHKLPPYTRVPKPPDPKNANAEDVTKYAGYFALQKYFDETILRELSKRYSKDTVSNILSRIKKNEIVVFNKGLFFSPVSLMEDPDDLAFKKGVTLERYLRDTVFEIKRQLTYGADRIVLSSFLINIARILEEAERVQIRMDDIYSLMNNFVLSIASIGSESPIYIRIFDDMLLRAIKNKYDICIDKYPLAVKLYFNAMTKVFDTRQKTAVEIPKIEFMRAVFYKKEYEILKKVEKEFKVPFLRIQEILENINIYTPSTELAVALAYIKSLGSDKTNTDVEKFMLKLTDSVNLEDTTLYFNTLRPSWENEFKAIKFYASVNKTRLYNKYVNIDFFRYGGLNANASIFVNCRNCISFDELEPLIDCAYKLGMHKFFKKEVRSLYNSATVLKITLFDVTFTQACDYDNLKGKLKKLRSESLKDIVFEVQYFSKRSIKGELMAKETECIRIIGDIHIDINKAQDYVFDFKDDFVVNCGDTSGDALTTSTWVMNNMRQGVFVHGNHLGYSGYNTLNKSIELLEKAFPDTGLVRYLNNSVYNYKGIIFLGCCLYTDFKLYGEDKQDNCKVAAARGMNDFVYPTYEDKNGVIRKLTTDDYEEFFIKSRLFLKEKLVEYVGKPVVIVTHFAPSMFSISKEFLNSPLNPAFAVDMTDLMKKYSNIRLWCHGHVHSGSDYLCYNTRVIARPFGYYTERNGKGAIGYGTRVKIVDIKSMRPWTDLVKDLKIYK